MSFTIRPVQSADRHRVVELAERLSIGVAPWRDAAAVAAAVEGWVVDATSAAFDGTCLVAVDDGAVVGFVSVSTTKHFSGQIDSYIGELVVAASHEGHGIGTALVTAAEEIAAERGHRCLALETGAANQHALDFYQQLGFAAEDIKLTKLIVP